VRPEIHGSSGFYQYDTIDGKDWVHINITVTIELGASAIDVLCSTFREIIAQQSRQEQNMYFLLSVVGK